MSRRARRPTAPADTALRTALRGAAPLAALFAASILVRAPFFSWPLISDEGAYAYIAERWAGGLTLYSPDLWLDRPQAIFLAYRLGAALLGSATWAIRLWGAVWAGATAVFVFLVARRFLGERTALLAGGLFVLASAAPQIEGFTANAEVFVSAAATGSVFFLLAGRPGAGGLLASTAFLLKPSGVSALLFGAAWLAAQRAPADAWARYVAAAVPLPALSLVHGWLTVGLPAYLYAVAGCQTHMRGSLPGDVARLAQSLGPTFPAWGLALALAVVGGIARKDLPRRLVPLWGASCAVGMALSGRWYWHYFIQVVPPLAVGAGCGIAFLLERRSPARAAVLSVVALEQFLFVASLAALGPERGSWRLYRRPGYVIAAEAAAYIRDRSSPGDAILVAFSEADIYHLARRRSAVAHLFRDHLFLPGVYEGLVATVRRRAPLYVLWLDEPPPTLDPGGRLREELERGYRAERDFRGRRLFRRIAGGGSEADAAPRPR